MMFIIYRNPEKRKLDETPWFGNFYGTAILGYTLNFLTHDSIIYRWKLYVS